MEESSLSENNMTVQEPLFSLDIEEYRPALGTAHLRSTAIASDGLEYAIKGVNDGDASILKGIPSPRQIPASEWLCTKLAEYSGLPTPTCRVLTDTSTGEKFFGSRYDLAAKSKPDDEIVFATSLMNGPSILRKQVWSVYAFDQFIFNIDRHIGNYLYTFNRQNHLTIQAFDFSLAAMVMGWPNKVDSSPLPEGCNTYRNWQVIRQLSSNDSSCKDSAVNVLDKISKISSNVVENFFASMPEEWVNPLQRDALLTWWSNDGRSKRIDMAMGEILK